MLPRYADTRTSASAWLWLKRRHPVVSALVRLLCPSGGESTGLGIRTR